MSEDLKDSKEVKERRNPSDQIVILIVDTDDEKTEEICSFVSALYNLDFGVISDINVFKQKYNSCPDIVLQMKNRRPVWTFKGEGDADLSKVSVIVLEAGDAEKLKGEITVSTRPYREELVNMISTELFEKFFPQTSS